MRTWDLMLDFLDAVKRTTGAESAAMVLHMEPAERETTLLVSPDGTGTVPELAAEESAWQLVSRQNGESDGRQAVTVGPSADPDGTLIRVAFSRILPRPKSERRLVDERRREPDVRTAPPTDGAIWIGLTRSDRADHLVAELEEDAAGDNPDGAWLGSLTGVCLRFVWSAYHLSRLLQDPISRLPGRMEFQIFLKRAMAAARRNKQAIGVMLVNPDDFTMINHRYGRRQGDLAVRQVADNLERSLRQTDGVFHYGGAVFAAVLPATDLDQCRAAADKVRSQLSSSRYVDDTVALTFTVGAAVATPEDIAARDGIESELAQRADAALNSARLSGGARVIVTDVKEGNSQFSALLNPLSGIFAADTEKDYRNMLLLWETVALISTQTVPESIATAFVDRLAIGFRPDRAALFSLHDDEFETLASNVRDDTAADGRASGRPIHLDTSGRNLVFEALETKRVARTKQDDDKSAGFSAYAVPLVARDAALACLYLDAGGRRMQLDSSDIVFLNALATQMAVAMDRAELAARWIREKDRESRLLRQEVRELRQALLHPKLVYQSAAMQSVMETLKKVAPSDATVLIVGESGTGKGMLAHSLHELSDRRETPFVVFDCGAVAHSLLEAELFGHKKGAFTGAESDSTGRIAQADGGTLFLDEIGELPLEVQAKLLRFVQEKEYSPVGSADTHRVDVRIVAATNRDLQFEVGAGRFRSDLYYRLRVIAVEAVPLRRRTEDILPLARHFLEHFAAQYGAPTHRFSSTAERKLLEYRWPGNVRELQHAVLRAVLTQETETLDAEAIELFPESTGDTTSAPVQPGGDVPVRLDVLPPQSDAQPAQEDPWGDLEGELERQVAAAVTQNSRTPVPIGRWLTEDLVLAANDLCDNVVRQAAQLVGVPESTFRRHLDKASSGALAGMDFRPDHWTALRPLLRRVIEHASDACGADGNLLDRARDALLECVRAKTPKRPGAGASLMGVTPPTYKRWLQAQEQTS